MFSLELNWFWLCILHVSVSECSVIVFFFAHLQDLSGKSLDPTVSCSMHFFKMLAPNFGDTQHSTIIFMCACGDCVVCAYVSVHICIYDSVYMCMCFLALPLLVSHFFLACFYMCSLGCASFPQWWNCVSCKVCPQVQGLYVYCSDSLQSALINAVNLINKIGEHGPQMWSNVLLITFKQRCKLAWKCRKCVTILFCRLHMVVLCSSTAAPFCFEFDRRMQLCWFIVYHWRAETS